MIGITTGRVTKTGTSEYGAWYIVAEQVRKRDGGTFDVTTFCSGKDSPPEGATVVVQGFIRAEVDSYQARDGEMKSVAKVKLNAASFQVLGDVPKEEAPAPDMADEDIPF